MPRLTTGGRKQVKSKKLKGKSARIVFERKTEMTDEKTINVTMRIRIGDKELEVAGPKEFVEKKIADFLKEQKSLGRAPWQGATDSESSIATPHTIPAQTTLHEFYRTYVHKIKSRPTMSVFFIYYLQKIRKKDRIKTADVAQCFKDISYPNWNNINVTDTLASAKKRALLNYVNKLWSLTTTGEDYVLNTIAGKAK